MLVEVASLATSEGRGRDRHAGEIELKKLGHLLLGYLPAMGGRIRPPRYLELEEHPMRGVETCTLCGVAVCMGEVSVRNLDHDLQLHVPFIGVHALVTHGDRAFRGALQGQGQGVGEIDVSRLKDVLNYEEYRLGRLITGLLAHTSLLPEHLTIDEKMTPGVLPCGECGDSVNMGLFRIANTHNDEALEVPYLALHALVEHKDVAYAIREGGPAESSLDIEGLRRILGQSRAHADFGTRIAGYLRVLGGEGPLPRHLNIIEHADASQERCQSCGDEVSGGHFELRNKHTGHEMQLPYVAIHSLASHGDAYFRGSVHRGWVDVPIIHRLVKRTWPIVQRVRRTRR